MTVRCSSCGATVLAEDVNITRMVAKCRACHAVFSFDPPQRAAQTALAPPPAQALTPLLDVALPAGIQVHREPPSSAASDGYRTAQGAVGRLRIVRRWFQPADLFSLFFAIVWNSFMVMWVGGAISSGAGIVPILGSSLHVAVGVWLAYNALTGLFNRTVIEVDGDVLSVRHGPIPARGNRDIPITDLRQLFTVEIVGNKGARTYELHAIVSSGPTLTIAKALPDARQARFLERVIEEHLGIVDQPVVGEIPK